MKVLYITTMYPIPAFPQQGIFCHEQVKALKELGVDVTVVVPIPFYDRQVKVSCWEYEGVQVQYIRFFKIPGPGDFHKTGKALYRQLNRKLDLSQFDIYHADAALPSGQAAMYAAKKYKKPFVVHGHGLDMFLDGSYKDARNCQKVADACKQVYEKADGIIGVSRKVLEKVQARVDIAGKDFVVFNGVDAEKFCPVEKPDTQKVTFISIGNLIPLKGHDYTMRAVRALVDKGHTNICLKLLGRGYLEQELKDLAKELDIEQYVDFVGYVPYDDVRKALQKSDVFVLPSWYEAFGCVYLEAMACGLPAIGCLGNGIDEVIVHGQTGYLVENKSLDQLTDSMERLLNPITRQKIGKAAAEAVTENYLWKHSAQALVQVYRKYAERKGKDGV